MTQSPTHQPASADHPGAGDSSPRSDVTALGDAGRDAASGVAGDVEDSVTRAAQARQTNAHRATYAAEALHQHARVSRSHARGMQQALVELLTDLHHLCDTCDLDLAPLYQAATLIHTRETRAA